MISSRILYGLTFARKFSVKIKPVVVTDENVLTNIQNNVFKPKKHPGIMNSKPVSLPDDIIKAIVSTTQDYPVKALLEHGDTLIRHLKGRVPPMEREERKTKTENVKSKVLSKYKDIVIATEEDEKRYRQSIESKIENILREKIYNWMPMEYNAYNSLLYLMARSAPEYAVLVQILREISSRDPNFKPRSLFDFGSGVGTATWAAQMYWKKNIFEYFNVDSSPDMNDLALILLQGGKGTGKLPKGTFYRQFLPATRTKYDLVVCAYSLLELPSLQARLQTVINLWNKTDRYLIVVEQGTNAGFKVVNEIRDFILQIKKESNEGHVFSPCPHDNICPRFLLDDGTPCNFETRYYTLPIGQPSLVKRERYSYVVLRKGKRSENDLAWPRIVRETLVRSKHTICRICSAEGKLGEVIFTAKRHGKQTYHCARASKWGDLLPVTVNFREVRETDDETNDNINGSEDSDISDIKRTSNGEIVNRDKEIVEERDCTTK